jgi:hypothetical protein
MANDNEAVRIISTELETQVRMADDRRVLAHTTQEIALDIVKALYAEGFEIITRENR